MKRLKLIIVFIMFMISGCSTSTIELNKNEDAISFSKRVIKGSASMLDKLISPARSTTTENNSYTYYSGEVIPLNSNIIEIRKQFSKHCSSKGGVFERGACKKNGSKDTVLYYTSIKHTGKIYKTGTREFGNVKHVRIRTIVPKKGLKDLKYRKAIRNLGYISPTHKKILNRFDKYFVNKQREIRQQILREELAQHNRELPYKRKIGTKICKIRKRVKYIGYVERTSDQRAQIRISYAHMVKSPSLSPSGFQPSIIWDNLRAWHLCD